MELGDLLTQGGAAAGIIIVLQVLKPAMGLAQETWQRFGALISIGIGMALVNGVNVAMASPLDVATATFTGFMAGAAASGLYQAGTRTVEGLRARLEEPPVADYDPKSPQG